MLLLDLLLSYFYTYQIQIQMEWIVSSPWAATVLVGDSVCGMLIQRLVLCVCEGYTASVSPHVLS